MYVTLADIVVIVHVAFVLFVVLGGLLATRWLRLAWLHLPAAAWGAIIELTGGECPLTPLENALRAWGGGAGYPESFVEHYLVPVLYPATLTRDVQLVLGMFVLGVNAGIYSRLLRRSPSEKD